MNNSGINRANLEYIEQLYSEFKNNPDAMAVEWKSFFEGVEFAQEGQFGMSDKELAVFQLIQTYRADGHIQADLNPLYPTKENEQLSLKRFGLDQKDLSAKFQVGSLIGKAGATLQDIITHLSKLYCGKISLQASDASPAEYAWLQKEFEGSATVKLPLDDKKLALQALTKAESLEKFVHTRYVGTKRFSVEGAETLLPMMENLVTKGSAAQVQEIFVGMAHRGRVNMLVNFFGKSEQYVFGDFNGPLTLETPIEDFDNDVKYHLGYITEKKTAHGTVKMTMAYNPSHLETVNAVALGMTRATQDLLENGLKKIVPVLIHGDAAFAGQGIVQEVLQMAGTRSHTTGGTIHIIIDNQVGFTTNGFDTRSTRYASDTAKMTFTPVLHVNGDDVEAGLRAMELALRYRQQFGKDVVINLICFRKFGHNEGDEPAFTQPLMYDIIKTHPTVREIYAKKLTAEGSIDQKQIDDLYGQAMDRLQTLFEETKKTPPKLKNFKFEGLWKGLRKATDEDFTKPWNTKFDLNTLKKIGEKIGSFPSSFTPHPKLIKLLDNRKSMGSGKDPIDWGMGEMLAYGSLLSEGYPVRLTGEDCVRGTFTHRHAGMYDIKTNKAYFPLADLNPKAPLLVAESILSEYGVMGFEYGYSNQNPNALVIWEAQFGDFVNGAQIIVDQYLAAAESKWQQMCSLVLLLPHGYEGQGPEHSSARLERFLQLCAQNNMAVVNLTTPAQVFHAMRRQMHRPFRKPLVVMSPKSLLRHPKAVSSLEDMANGTFQEVIDDKIEKSKVDTVVFVSGKLYYELLEEREKTKKENVALVRLEQIYPFPANQVTEILKSYSKAKTLIWAQEEPKNMGAFTSVYFRFVEVVGKAGLKLGFEYVGRPERSSPATGSIHRHKNEQAEIIKSIFGA